MAEASTNRQSLTGVWQGRYAYPAKLAPVEFVATLIEAGSLISGTTHEPGASIRSKGAMAYAMVSGHRGENHVTFVKTYEDGGEDGREPIEYDGTINADATEITGNWIIFGVWGGTFQMVRSPGKAAKAKRKATISIR